MGMGTDIRGGDYTKPAQRALRDALWHNSLSVGAALGQSPDDMHVIVTIGVPEPDKVDAQAVLDILPHGTSEAKIVKGGLEVPNEAGDDKTVIAIAAAEVWMEIPRQE
jgi:uncharacterized protein (TIGR02058 family)